MSIEKIFKQVYVVLLCGILVEFTAQVDAYGSIPQSNDQPVAGPGKKPSQELQQLVAPIALYPDALVAQIFHAQPGARSSAFSGFDHGGNVRGFSSRGQSSFGGGSHGGGGHR